MLIIHVNTKKCIWYILGCVESWWCSFVTQSCDIFTLRPQYCFIGVSSTWLRTSEVSLDYIKKVDGLYTAKARKSLTRALFISICWRGRGWWGWSSGDEDNMTTHQQTRLLPHEFILLHYLLTEIKETLIQFIDAYMHQWAYLSRAYCTT